MLVLGMVFAVLVAVAAEVGTIKNDLAQAQPRRFPKRKSCERSRTVMGFEKKVQLDWGENPRVHQSLG